MKGALFAIITNYKLLHFTASHVSKHPCLNFVLYIPPCSSSPLYIYTKKGFHLEEANAFISPKWGGIQIFNPDR